jgi:hypothetical protein
MKNGRMQSKDTSRRGGRIDANMPKPEKKDNLDSRERKEAGYRQNDDDTNKADKKQKSKRP